MLDPASLATSLAPVLLPSSANEPMAPTISLEHPETLLEDQYLMATEWLTSCLVCCSVLSPAFVADYMRFTRQRRRG